MKKTSVFSLWVKCSFVASSLLLVSACSEESTVESGQRHVDRAQIYRDQGQYKAAVIEYKNAIKNSPGDAGVVAYADMLNDLAQHRAANKLLESYQGEKGQEYYFEMIESFVGLSKFSSAKSVFDDHITEQGRDSRIVEAEILVGLGKDAQGERIYESILAKNEKDADAILGKAGLMLKDGKIDEAKSLLEQIESGQDAYIRAQVLIASLQIHGGELEAAEAGLTNLLTLLPNTDMMRPEKALVLERLSYVLTRLGRSNEAYIYTKLLAEAFPGMNEMNEKYTEAVDKLKEGDIDGSYEMLSALIKEYPGNIRVSQLLGMVSYFKGDHEKALEYFSDRVDPEVADPLATQIYAASSLKMNEPKKVLALLEDSIEHSDKVETIALYGLAAISDKQYKKGEQAIKRALKLGPNNYKLHLLMASYLRDKPQPDLKGEYQYLKQAFDIAPTELQVLKDLFGHIIRNNKKSEGQAIVSNLLANHSKEYAAQITSGYFYASTGEAGKAIKHFKEAAKLETAGSKLRNALYAQGRTEAANKRLDDAKRTFNSIIDKFPEDQLGYHGLFGVLAENNFDNAVSELERIASEKQSMRAYQVLVSAALRQKNGGLANRYLAKAKAINSEDPDFNNLSSSVALFEAVEAASKKDFTLARELIAPLLLDNPENSRLLSFLVELEIKDGQLKEAEKVLARIKQLDSNSLAIPVLSGDLALANKRLDEAKGFYMDAWKGNPNEVVANKVFQLLGKLGETKEQMSFVSDWLEALPRSVNATLYRAMHDQSNGRAEQAKSGYEKVIKIRPNNVTVLNNLGWLYYEDGNRDALTLLEKATKLAPENAAVLDSFGWVLAKFGDASRGLTYLEKANQLAPENKEIAQHLEEVRAQL